MDFTGIVIEGFESFMLLEFCALQGLRDIMVLCVMQALWLQGYCGTQGHCVTSWLREMGVRRY